MAVALQPPPSEEPAQKKSPLMASLDIQARMKRAYSGKESPAAATPARRTPSSNGREAAPAMASPAGVAHSA